MSSESSVIITVLMIAGIMEEFSVVYFQANKSGFRCGMPFTRIYTTSETTSAAVTSADKDTSMNKSRDPGLFL